MVRQAVDVSERQFTEQLIPGVHRYAVLIEQGQNNAIDLAY